MSVVCENLIVEYSVGGYTVRPIDGLNVEVLDGELALLLGASGCGKTTLLSVLAAILHPTGGSVRLDNLEITGLQGGALTQYRQHKVGLVFQAFNLISSLTASENVQGVVLNISCVVLEQSMCLYLMYGVGVGIRENVNRQDNNSGNVCRRKHR